MSWQTLQIEFQIEALQRCHSYSDSTTIKITALSPWMIGTAARLTYLLVEDFVKRQLIPLLQVLLQHTANTGDTQEIWKRVKKKKETQNGIVQKTKKHPALSSVVVSLLFIRSNGLKMWAVQSIQNIPLRGGKNPSGLYLVVLNWARLGTLSFVWVCLCVCV